MSMKKYFLQVEALNIVHFVYDTHDISTIRGGSYILLDAIKNLQTELEGKGFHPVSTAASMGLFSFERTSLTEVEEKGLQQQVLEYLDKQTDGHATFCAAIEQDIQKDFPSVLQKLQAKIRRQQWRFPTVRIPEYQSTDQEGYLDGWRPGAQQYRVDPNVKNARISTTTQFRRDKGRILKHRLFAELLGEDTSQEQLVTRDLGLLARDTSKGILNGKIAFIHLDGNKFGAIRGEKCITPELRSEFDDVIQENIRKPFLKALLELATHDPDFQTEDENGRRALRLEVLLWGGDEVTLVVPSWKGLEVLRLFYSVAMGKTFEDKLLTHRGALIFCHHNAPILQIRGLAEDLLDRTKSDIAESLGQDQDAFHYLVLESFDMIHGSLNDFVERYYQDGRTAQAGHNYDPYTNLLLQAQELDALREHLITIQAHSPKGKIFDILEALRRGDIEAMNRLQKEMSVSLKPSQAAGVQSAISAVVGNNPRRWYLISDLWDYAKEWKS